ncbi:aminoacyl-tRNA hydrolase [bacterium]|nr:aminoacyl-tRNA hydrolase [bacterium]MBP9810598.1 aminoacyl-tRNA hydrolase [bacterium]
MTEKLKMVLVVRNDLNMRKGKVGAQTGHAVQEAIIDRSGPNSIPILKTDELTQQWLSANYPKTVVRVDSEAELLDIYKQACEAGLNTRLVQDLGTTEFHGQLTYTVVAVGPDWSDSIDPITGHLKLL